ncbi:uncharacterized protein dok2 isoform X4 [Gambusia affinis]|uniref:uncharacterized protein dok2 isoform X4 n=1 Tax=Gambusia affinis TaxID=33528 RepID=UPI001CDD7F34|nr:uncharacterized protein dok2 isoform X4 [Gambusia affinis]
MSLRSSEFPLSPSYKVTGSDPVQSEWFWFWAGSDLVLVLDDLPLNIRLSSSKLQEADPGSHVSIFSCSVLSGSEWFCRKSEVRTNVSRSCCSTSCSTCSSLSHGFPEQEQLRFLCHIQNQNQNQNQRQGVRDFKVSVRRTDASDRCRLKGDGVLKADMDALHLMDKTGDILYTWPYRYLRRFGRDKSTFSFEAGRRCDSGEGSFEFDTKQGNLLFQAVEAAINLQKISLPHRQTSGGGPMPPEPGPNHHNLTLPAPPANPALGHSRPPPQQKQPRVQVQQVQQGDEGVYSMVTEPQHLQKIHNKDAESSNSSQQQRPQLACLEPPVDKMLTGVKSLTLDTRGLPAPRKSQVKMISSCPLPNASPESGGSQLPGPASSARLSPKLGSNPNLEQTYSQISLADVAGRAAKKDKKGKKGSGAAVTGRDPDYSLPFDTLSSNILSDILAADQGGPGADPLYDSIDELKIRNIFRSEARTTDATYGKVDHIYDEPEGCAVATGPPAAPHPSVYDDPEEMRGDAWRIMGTSVDPKGHEYPYNPRVDDYAVPRRPKRAFASQKSIASEEEEEQKQEEEPQEEEEGDEEQELEEKQFSPYDNLVVKMA